jgi:L-lactate dehydrogenase complex protein LldE
MRVGLFVTCVNDAVFPQTGEATVTLLERLGVTVDFQLGQTCCGQMHFNTGYRADAVPLARRFADVFEGYDAVVVPSGSCGAFIRDTHHKLDPKAADKVPPVYELSEFLIDVLDVEDVGASFPHTVTYHPTCHGLRMLKLGDRPQRLLRAVSGLTLIELPYAEECCGFGGTFSVKNPDVSEAMGADKLDHARETGAEVLCAVDNSCLMHLGGMAGRRGDPVRVMHIAEILASVEGA